MQELCCCTLASVAAAWTESQEDDEQARLRTGLQLSVLHHLQLLRARMLPARFLQCALLSPMCSCPPLQMLQRLMLLRGCALGLQLLHSKSIVHGDLVRWCCAKASACQLIRLPHAWHPATARIDWIRDACTECQMLCSHPHPHLWRMRCRMRTMCSSAKLGPATFTAAAAQWQAGHWWPNSQIWVRPTTPL